MSEPLRPYFWIRRNADTYVPLIPLDELPSWIALRGVSSTKNWEDICRGEMRFLGDHYDHNGDHFVVDIVSFTNATAGQDGGSGPGASLFTPAKGASVGATQTKTRAKDENANSSVDQIQANIDKITSGQDESPEESQDGSEAETPKFQGNPGTLGKKVYCTYWIRTGNCNYMQEGCKYKHEIPPDDETRLAIGVRTYPTWPREDPVTAPRPPPLKAWQVPPVSKPDIKQSWRRHEAKGAAQVELPGPQRSPQHVTPPQASGPVPMFTHPLPGSFSPAVTSGSRQPTNAQSGPVQHISPANAAQHFPSYVNHAKQQSSHAQAGMPEFTRGHGQFQTQPTTTAGSYNNQPTNLTPQLQSMSLTNNIQNRPVAILQTPSRPSPRGNKQAPAPPPGKGNPFTQRVSSGTPSQPQNNAHASATPANSFKSGASKSSHAPGPSVQTTVPPPYMPIFMKARPKTAEALTGTISSQPSGEAFEQHSSTSDTGSNSTSGSAAHGQGTASPTHNGSNNAASSTSHVNTPGSSNNTIHGASNVNSVIEQREHASVASGTRTATHATGNRNPSGNSFGNSRFSFSGLDPAIIATARTHAPVSVKGRGPILFNPYAQDESNGKAATSEHGSIANSFADVRSPTFSPPPIHRRMFRAPGEEEFVANPLEDAHTKSDRTTKKHVGSNGSAKGRKTSHPSKHHGRPQNQSNNGDYLG